MRVSFDKRNFLIFEDPKQALVIRKTIELSEVLGL